MDTKPVQAGAYQLIASYVIPEDGIYDIISFMDVNVSDSGMYNNAIFINADSESTYKDQIVTRSTMLSGGGNIAYMITSLKKGDSVKAYTYTSAPCNVQARLTVARRF